MSKHQGPWHEGALSFIRDANGKAVCAMKTRDPETRVRLLHAGEMFAALNEITSVEPGSPAHRHADKMCCQLMRKIEAEITAGKGDSNAT